MSLAEQLAQTRTAARIITLDIERLPGRARHQHRGLTIEGDFWDLSGWKHAIGYRLPPESVLEWPRTICGAWRFLGERKIHFASEWGDGHEAMVQRLWDALNEADIAIGHNFDNFDRKHLNTDFATLGLGRPAPYKTVDTLKVARAAFGAESKTLHQLNKRFGRQGKVDRYQVQVARDAVAGVLTAQRRIERYNKGDIPATETLYLDTRVWAPNHPHLGLYTGDERSCHVCGCTEFVRLPKDVVALSQSYGGYRCAECGAPSRNNHRKRITTMRPAR